MREKERKLLARVESRRLEMVTEADRLSAEQLTFRPAPHAWSALDVLEHLVKVEEGIASRLRPREPRKPLETVKAKVLTMSTDQALRSMRTAGAFMRDAPQWGC